MDRQVNPAGDVAGLRTVIQSSTDIVQVSKKRYYKKYDNNRCLNAEWFLTFPWLTQKY